jgi:hypothetical protein
MTPDVFEDLAESAPGMNAVELADALVRCRQVQTAAARCAAVLEAEIVALGEPVEHPVYGRFSLDVRTERRKWEHNRLANLVAERALDERRVTRDGDVEAPHEAVLRVLMECVSISAWKLTGLRRLDVDLDEYCTVEHTVKVVLPEAAKP